MKKLFNLIIVSLYLFVPLNNEKTHQILRENKKIFKSINLEEKIHYCNIAYVFNENLHKFILEYFKLESCTLTEFEKINRLEYKGSNMGIYREIKDVIYMNIPCNIYSSSDNLEQQADYELSLILDEYKRILKEEQEINMGNELVIFKDCLQKAVKEIASTL